MASIIGVNDPKAVRKYSAFLATDTARVSYFQKKFMGRGPDTDLPIQMLTELENDDGDKITFDLSMQLKMAPIEGEAVLKDKEEKLQFYTDEIFIDIMRGGVDAGSKMSRKRTVHKLRDVARKREGDWWGRVFDELYFMYLSGSRGTNSDYVFPLTYTGFGGNAFVAPDSDHTLYAGSATSKATVAATDKMSVGTIDKLVSRATMMGGGTQEMPQIQPIMIEGEIHYVLVMNPWQAYDVRTTAGAGNWLEIQKAAATAEGRKSRIFKGGLGMHNGVVLHEHKGVLRYTDYGAGGNVAAARALFMGAQAGVCAFGSPGSGHRFGWNEELDDRGNRLIITTDSIFGVKKTRYNSKDFGVIATDTAAADPAPVT